MEKPKVRFVGFEDKWNKRSYSETFSFLRHNSLSRAELDLLKGSIKNVHYGDILIKFDNILDVNKESLPYIADEAMALKLAKDCSIQNGDIIFADAAEDNTVGKCVEIVSRNEDALVSGLHTIPSRPLFKFSECYLGYFLNANSYHNQLLPLIQGTKISSISKSALQKTIITFPSTLSEQQQIASYFKSLDSLIHETKKKVSSLKQLKSASFQSMFPQAGETKPRVRFKGFEGEWIEKKISDISQKIIEKNRNLKYNMTLTNSAEYGIINQLDFFDHQVSNGDNIKGYYIVENDDFVYNPRISATAPVGPINRQMLGYTGVMSPLYYVFKVYGVDKNYLDYFFKTDIWHKFIKDNGNTGARFDRIAISDTTFENMPILQPASSDEQHLIANFFRSLNTQISLETELLEKLKQIKSACLDKMFV